jgi:protein pelota
MRIIKESIDIKRKCGSIRMSVEHPDDVYTLYNLIYPGDKIKSLTQRKVTLENGKTQQKIYILMEIRVESTSVDLESATLFAKGKTISENERVKTGSYHTIDITLNTEFRLTKNEWNTLSLKSLKEMKKDYTEILFMILNEKECVISSVTSNFIKILFRQEIKRKGYKDIVNWMIRKDLKSIKLVVIAGFHESRNEMYSKLVSNPGLREYEKRFCVVKLENRDGKSGNSKTIENVLKDPYFSKKFMDIQFIKDLKEMDKFLDNFMNCSLLCSVGMEEVKESMEYGAVRSLLITNEVLKSYDVAVRREVEQLCRDVEQSGGAVYIIPAKHYSGAKLDQMGGICANLKYSHREME